MKLLLDERENTLTMMSDYNDVWSIWKVRNVRETKSLLEEVIKAHTLSESGTTIEVDLISGQREEVKIP